MVVSVKASTKNKKKIVKKFLRNNMQTFFYKFYLLGLVGQEFGTLMVPAGDEGGDTLR